jgi:hypothetical protein
VRAVYIYEDASAGLPIVHSLSLSFPSIHFSHSLSQHSFDTILEFPINMKFSAAVALFASFAAIRARVIFRQANAQSFTGALGGVEATPVLDSGNADRPFSVKGDTFVNVAAALQRSCDQQFNGCANLANAGQADFSTEDCQAQKRKF